MKRNEQNEQHEQERLSMLENKRKLRKIARTLNMQEHDGEVTNIKNEVKDKLQICSNDKLIHNKGDNT